MLLVRRAGAADAPVIVEFNRLLAQESEGLALEPGPLQAGVAAALADPHKGLYFMAELDGTAVGQTMVTFEWSDWRNGWMWWIQSVYVRPEHRRRGVFRALYDHVRRAAADDPAVIGLRLYVVEHNHAAREVYTRLGWQSTGYHVLERCPL
jgi:GNAT superfamily N-acetyltransferase